MCSKHVEMMGTVSTVSKSFNFARLSKLNIARQRFRVFAIGVFGLPRAGGFLLPSAATADSSDAW